MIFFDTPIKSHVAFERKIADITANFLTKFLGSMLFLNISIAFIVIWMVVNLGWISAIPPFDPYPFIFLASLATFGAILLAILVLINQNQQGKKADIRQRIDFEVNVRAEHEITKILAMFEELNLKLGLAKVDKELDKMLEKIDIATIKEDVELGIEKEDAGMTRRPL